MGVPKFAFYEKVLVDTRDNGKATINGQVGSVLGRVESDDIGWSYTVLIDEINICWHLFENELLPLGEFAKREDFYNGSSIHVIVDRTGKGEVVDQSKAMGPE